mmetsp:Transcript_10687/g.21955  ORF Transcript_10687/g.21955 Transcript_10687/m.21955 type:complete len:147 (-) Transcript_10687:206-646(-)
MIPLSLVNRNEVDDEEKVRVSPSKKKKCCSSCRSENKAGGGSVMSDPVVIKTECWLVEDDLSPQVQSQLAPLAVGFSLIGFSFMIIRFFMLHTVYDFECIINNGNQVEMTMAIDHNAIVFFVLQLLISWRSTMIRNQKERKALTKA